MDSSTKVKFIFDTDLKSLYQKVKSGHYEKEDAQRLACFVGDKAGGQAKARKLSQDRSEGRSQ